MTTIMALQLIIDNQDNPALNYAIKYAKEAKHILMYQGKRSEEFRVQVLYILSNLSGWRQNKKFTITKETIKLVKETLKGN